MNNPSTNSDQTGLDLSNGNGTETAEQRYIRLLSILAQADEPVSSDETWLLVDIAAMAQLAGGGLISAGDIVRDGTGRVCAIVRMEILPSGRAYLAELKQREEALTSVGFVKQNRFHFYKWFFGIVAAIVAGYFVWRLTH
jgi:hypothetical protein